MYGMGQVNYETSLGIAEVTDVKFNKPVWLPGVDTLTMKPDGSVRAYGTWTGKSISTGRTFRYTIILILKMEKLLLLGSTLMLQVWLMPWVLHNEML